MMTRSSHLDDADLWLLKNDPQLFKTTPRALASRRLRQQHVQGRELLDNVIVVAEGLIPRQEADTNTARLVRLAPPALRKLVALRVEFPSASQAELARMLGCSRQAVSKKRRKLLAYLQTMAAPPPPQTSGSVTAAPFFMESNGQIAWDFVDYE